jgi:aerobic-type carbon monoxide dehydrogenase small subunit (CoxS/CutS family)
VRAGLPVSFTVNGEAVEVSVEPRKTLADTLRDELGLVATKLGCEHGACGACTVLVDGSAIRSCLMLGVQAEGTAIETLEGLGHGGELSALQRAFRDHHALQCGFCTAGFLMSVTEYLRRADSPTEREVREALSGNLCRCTGYQGIVEAVLETARAREPGT